MFLNLEGREAQGIVEPGAEAAALQAGDRSEADGPARRRTRRDRHHEAFDTAALYAGPYLENAPDLIIGYNAGYRTSWDCATGRRVGAGLRGQRQGVERRSLHRSAARARRVVLQPGHRRRPIRRSSTSRRRRCSCSASSRRLHGRRACWRTAATSQEARCRREVETPAIAWRARRCASPLHRRSCCCRAAVGRRAGGKP